MSWTAAKINIWDPSWLFLNPADPPRVNTQEKADKFFSTLGYGLNPRMVWQNDDGGRLTQKPEVRPAVDVLAEIDTLKTRIMDSWRALPKGQEEACIHLRYLELSEEDTASVLDQSWAAVCPGEDMVPRYRPCEWLRDHARGLDQSGEVGNWPDGEAPAEYGQFWGSRLLYNRALGEAEPPQRHFLVPDISYRQLRSAPCFMNFLYSRIRTRPERFWRKDWNRCYIGRANRLLPNDFLAGRCLEFGVDIRAGTAQYDITMRATDEWRERMLNGHETLAVADALNVLRAQAIIYPFLEECCRRVAAIDPDRWNEALQSFPQLPSEAEEEEHVKDIITMAESFQDMDRLEARVLFDGYRKIEQADIDRMRETVIQRKHMAFVHFYQLRRYPEYWIQQVDAELDLHWAHVRNADGKLAIEEYQDTANFELAARAETVTHVVTRAVGMLNYWNMISKTMEDNANVEDRIKALRAQASADNTSAFDLTQSMRPFRVERDLNDCQLYMLARQALEEVRGHFVRQKFGASPKFRALFERVTSPTDPSRTTLLLRPDRVQYATLNPDARMEYDMAMDLARAVLLLGADATIDHAGIIAIVELIASFLDEAVRDLKWAQEYLTGHMFSLLSDVCVLGRLLRQLEQMASFPHDYFFNDNMPEISYPPIAERSLARIRNKLKIQNREVEGFMLGQADSVGKLYPHLGQDASAANHAVTLAFEKKLRVAWEEIDRRIIASLLDSTRTQRSALQLPMNVPLVITGSQLAIEYKKITADVDSDISGADPWTDETWSPVYETWYRFQTGDTGYTRDESAATIGLDAETFSVAARLFSLHPNWRGRSVTFAELDRLMVALQFNGTWEDGATMVYRFSEPDQPPREVKFEWHHYSHTIEPYMYARWVYEKFMPVGIAGHMIYVLPDV